MQSDEIFFHAGIYLEQLTIIKGIHFTEREIDVVAALLSMRGTNRIASLLSIAPRTVVTHLRNIMLKIECNSRDGIIDFFEKSNEISLIRKHYAILHIKEDFEKNLRSFARYKQEETIPSPLLCLYSPNQRHSLTSDLNNHLEKAGIKAIIRDFNVDKNREDAQCPSCVALLLLESDQYLKASERSSFSNFIDLSAHQNYYVLFFDLLKRLLPAIEVEEKVSYFKERSNKAIDGAFLPPSQLYLEENNSSDLGTALTVSKKNMGLIIFLFGGVLCLFFAFHIIKPKIFGKKVISAEKPSQNPSATSSNLPAPITEVFPSSKTKALVNKIDKKQEDAKADIQGITTENKQHLANHFGLPFPNLYFSGRESELKAIAEKFCKEEATASPISVVVCTGLGGIGKTEIAKRYIHSWHHYTHKKYSLRVWFNAGSLDRLIEEYRMFGLEVKLPLTNAPPSIIIEKVRNWFEDHPQWLIIYDNAEDFDALLKFLPRQGGHILITSRSAHWPHRIEISSMTNTDAITLAYTLLNHHQSLSDIKSLVQQLSNMPLAISQACAYILRKGKTIAEYLKEYTDERNILLASNGMPPGLKNSPVFTTWNINLKEIKKKSKTAYNLINILTYLHPDNIPRKDLLALLNTAYDSSISPHLLDEAIENLLHYSMITWDPDSHTLSIHPLVQTVLWQNQRSERTQKDWLLKVLKGLLNDEQAFLMLGGAANYKGSLNDIIQSYEGMPNSKKDTSFYQSLGCTYLANNNFRKAEQCFLLGIQKGGDSSIHCEYGQALYLRGRFSDAIKQLELSIKKAEDSLFSYFSHLEKSSVDKIIQKEIENVGAVKIRSSLLAYYFIVRCYAQLQDRDKYNFYLRDFQREIATEQDPFLYKLLDHLKEV